MGLAGRDPIFFAQVASEVDTFHRASAPLVQETCLGCHGVLGQRQNAIDSRAQTGKCAPLSRASLDAVPYQASDPAAQAAARYGALAREGVSCTSCHHMVLGEKETAAVADDPQNKCVAERQAELNPGLTGFAKTFTGSFFVGPPDKLYGPFKEPKVKPMKNALGIEPAHGTAIISSELCGSCHTVHLPILKDGHTLGHVYEQSTYPEWAFSDFRTGDSPDGALPYGAGPAAQSCQACHMPNKDALGNPYRSKIATIQEYTSFPQAEHTLAPDEIDLKERAGFGKHTLVGLNVFLLMMAEQFPEVLGLRPADPMLTTKGIDSIPAAVDAMIDQGINRTAAVTVGDVSNDGTALAARVTVINQTGHKFPSGVGFRRAFIQFDVLDVGGNKLWSSGRTDAAGVIVGADDKPIAGELWWKDDCSARIEPDARIHQPHYREIARQDQAQIYQELVSTAPDVPAPACGPGVPPAGHLTTSFLSICTKVKDNRLLPRGFLSLEKRREIAAKLGAGEDMAQETDPVGVGDDPDFTSGGSDSLVYRVPLAELKGGKPAAIQATLYYQATPPFYLQDRFCTSHGDDTQRLYYLAGNLKLAGSLAQEWKLRVVTSGPLPVP
jgi:cytochrome c551/c552